jgi:3-oxoacyl-[acyl-carrier protein] reductase
MMKSLEGRVAVITGAANGVGLGIATVLAAEGARVAIADVDGAAAAAAAERLRGEGADALAVEVDVVDRQAVEAMVAAVLERHGRLDILAANAGIYPAIEMSELTDRDWDRVMDINVKGAMHAIQAALPGMREQAYGRIVLTSSITGPIVGQRGMTAYAASKAALLGMMRSAALEVAADGITINAVQPGNVRTPGFERFGPEFEREMVRAIPMGRVAEPADVGWAVRFLASEEAAYITGQTLVSDGGQVLPEGASPASIEIT